MNVNKKIFVEKTYFGNTFIFGLTVKSYKPMWNRTLCEYNKHCVPQALYQVCSRRNALHAPICSNTLHSIIYVT